MSLPPPPVGFALADILILELLVKLRLNSFPFKDKLVLPLGNFLIEGMPPKKRVDHEGEGRVLREDATTFLDLLDGGNVSPSTRRDEAARPAVLPAPSQNVDLLVIRDLRGRGELEVEADKSDVLEGGLTSKHIVIGHHPQDGLVAQLEVEVFRRQGGGMDESGGGMDESGGGQDDDRGAQSSCADRMGGGHSAAKASSSGGGNGKGIGHAGRGRGSARAIGGGGWSRSRGKEFEKGNGGQIGQSIHGLCR